MLIERRLWKRWFLEVELTKWSFTVGIERFPRAADVVGSVLADEARAYIEEQDD